MSCGVRKKANNSFDTAFYPIMVTQAAMTKFMVESTSSIYTKYSLNDRTPVYIYSLNASFTGKNKSFNLVLDSIEAIKIQDSIIFNNKTVPTYKSFILKQDTMKVKVTCRYRSPSDSIDVRCLSCNYEIFDYLVNQIGQYVPCQ